MDQSAQSMSLLHALLSAALIPLGAIRVRQKVMSEISQISKSVIRIRTMRTQRKSQKSQKTHIESKRLKESQVGKRNQTIVMEITEINKVRQHVDRKQSFRSNFTMVSEQVNVTSYLIKFKGDRS
eukprot:2358010-Amphidinium_carterae.1